MTGRLCDACFMVGSLFLFAGTFMHFMASFK